MLRGTTPQNEDPDAEDSDGSRPSSALSDEALAHENSGSNDVVEEDQQAENHVPEHSVIGFYYPTRRCLCALGSSCATNERFHKLCNLTCKELRALRVSHRRVTVQ